MPGNATVKPLKGSKPYRCGTLTYTKAGLAAVFAALLWGDFCYVLMDSVVPSILPLKLKALGCSNTLIGLILTTAPSLLGIGMVPYISVKSDRHRSRWGRRIPFIAWTLPFLCGSLGLLAYSQEIAGWLVQNAPFLRQSAPATVAIAAIALFYTMFRFFSMFVSSVFFYLFNDVVPAQFLARFFGAFRIVGTAAGALYSFFIFGLGETHMRELFLGASLLYFAGFSVLCLVVKEGEYPPVESDVSPVAGRAGGLMSFFKESFTNSFYLSIFLFVACISMGNAIGTFGVFFNREMGLSLDQIGRMGAIGQVSAVIAIYVSAVFIDRWNPMRVAVYVSIFGVIHNFTPWPWIFVTLPSNAFFWLLLSWMVISQFQAGLAGASGMPLYTRVFPQSKFGQFCSAQSLLCTLLTLASSVGAGMFIDVIAHFCRYPEFGYRFIFIWSTIFSIAATAFIVLAYRKWYRLGGDAHFHPPASWRKEGVEELPIVTTVGPQSYWLGITFRLLDAMVLLSAIGIASLAAWMFSRGAMVACWWHVGLLLPFSLSVIFFWVRLKNGILADIDRVRRGEMPKNGVPHHGVLFIAALKFLLALAIWGMQVIVSINLSEQMDAVIFTVASIIVNFLVIGAVWVLCRVERGFSVTIDRNLAQAVA
jgi:MFS family permease